ncbi:MAG: MaoC family dehydratase [Flavobacteriaceae bacterium]|jgi:acyl dehydratase|nr:MaoC family dehydratase [Flavobacteriaceae bacterium]MDG2314073.1 MaoC family dehydratase [Flavobacteriaceae bacterium]
MTNTNNAPYKTEFKQLSEMKHYVGKELGISNWHSISQEQINAFAKVTGDNQWIHTDPEMAATHSPYKTTVVHGFFILSLIPKFCNETFAFLDVNMGINYGLDKVRFMRATKVASPVRAKVSLMEFTPIPAGAKYKLEIVFELEDEKKPACIAEFIGLAYLDKP